MCMCGKPTVNGEPGYSWSGERTSVRPVDPPDLCESDVLLYDEPGRCGGLDSHSHHFRVVKSHGSYALLVRHGGGDERIRLPHPGIPALANLDSNGRYWLLLMIHSAASHANEAGRSSEYAKWHRAAADKRIKTRKLRTGAVKVWIDEPKIMDAPANY